MKSSKGVNMGFLKVFSKSKDIPKIDDELDVPPAPPKFLESEALPDTVIDEELPKSKKSKKAAKREKFPKVPPLEDLEMPRFEEPSLPSIPKMPPIEPKPEGKIELPPLPDLPPLQESTEKAGGLPPLPKLEKPKKRFSLFGRKPKIKKKTPELKLPELPPLEEPKEPEVPELPPLEEHEAPQFPTLPGAEFTGISPEEKTKPMMVQQPLHTLPKEPIHPLTKEKPKIRIEKPVAARSKFIRIENFGQVLTNLDHIKDKLKGFEDNPVLEDAQTKVDGQLNKWNSIVNDINRKLNFVEKTLFER